MRVGHAVLGGTAGIVWLMLPVMTSGERVPVAIRGGDGTSTSTPAVSAAPVPAPAPTPAPTRKDESSGSELLLPLAALGTASAFAGYGYVRRTRRARTRTTPGGTPAGAGAAVVREDIPATADERRVAALLVAREAVSDADDFVAAHGTAVGRAARTRLAEARRLLASPEPDDPVAAETLAREARALAEQDVRRTVL